MDYFQFKLYEEAIAKKPTVTQAKDLYIKLIPNGGEMWVTATNKHRFIPKLLLLHSLKSNCPKLKFSKYLQYLIYNAKEKYEQTFTLYDTSGEVSQEWFFSPTRKDID